MEAVTAYKERGYHFLCLSEHDLYTDYRNNYNTEEFILLPGLEASAILFEREGSNLRKQVHHIHGILGTSQMQKDAKLPGLKHLEGLKPEIYYGEWDSARASGNLSTSLRERGLFPDSGGGYICVKAERLSHDAIIENILAENFYSSSGPTIHAWGIREGSVFAECSPVNRINFIAGNYVNAGTTVMHPEKEDILTEATYHLTGKESYVRVECIDIYGNTAWSNAIFL